MRPVTLSWRNWTSAGSDAGGLRAAAIYGLNVLGILRDNLDERARRSG